MHKYKPSNYQKEMGGFEWRIKNRRYVWSGRLPDPEEWRPTNQTVNLSKMQSAARLYTCIPWATGGWRTGWSCTCCSKRPTLDVYMYIGGSSSVRTAFFYMYRRQGGVGGAGAVNWTAGPHLTCQSSRSATLCHFFIEKEEVL